MALRTAMRLRSKLLRAFVPTPSWRPRFAADHAIVRERPSKRTLFHSDLMEDRPTRRRGVRPSPPLQRLGYRLHTRLVRLDVFNLLDAEARDIDYF